MLEVCKLKCPDEEIQGDINLCTTFRNPKSELTFVCGRKATATRAALIRSNDLCSEMDDCINNCPNKEIEGNVSQCEEFLLWAAQQGFPDGQEPSREELKNLIKKPQKAAIKRGRPRKKSRRRKRA